MTLVTYGFYKIKDTGPYKYRGYFYIDELKKK